MPDLYRHFIEVFTGPTMTFFAILIGLWVSAFGLLALVVFLPDFISDRKLPKALRKPAKMLRKQIWAANKIPTLKVLEEIQSNLRELLTQSRFPQQVAKAFAPEIRIAAELAEMYHKPETHPNAEVEDDETIRIWLVRGLEAVNEALLAAIDRVGNDPLPRPETSFDLFREFDM